MIGSPFEWQAAAGELHAIPSTSAMAYPALPGMEVTTLCALQHTLQRNDFHRVSRPMCGRCHAAWVSSQQPRTSVRAGDRQPMRRRSAE